MVAVARPGLGKSSLNDRTAMSVPAILRVSYDIFDESVSTSAAQKIWRGNKHAGRGDPGAGIRDENSHSLVRQRLGPDAFGMVSRLCDCTHFRHSEEIEQPFQIGCLSEPRCWHLYIRLEQFRAGHDVVYSHYGAGCTARPTIISNGGSAW